MNTDPQEPLSVSRLRPARDTGGGAGPVRVLLLHGLAAGPAVWEPFAALADPAYELWAAALPWRGSGVPGWADPPAADWAGRAVAAVPGGPHVLIAHSFGASALLGWLAERGTAPGAGLAGVVLVSPFYRASEDDFGWETLEYHVGGFTRILEEGLRVSTGGRLEPDIRHEMAVRIRDRIGPYGFMRFFGTYLGTPRLPLDRLRTPFLVVGGREDRAAPPAEAERLAEALPDGRALLLPDAGHFAMVERPDEFTEAVHGFLRTTGAKRGQDGATVPSLECN